MTARLAGRANARAVAVAVAVLVADLVVAAVAVVAGAPGVARADAGAGADACAAGPEGMKCVPAGTVSVGEGDAKRDVLLARFFIDEHAVTVHAYKACVDAKACAPIATHGKAADAPIVVDWPRAERYCAFAGKRLASEAEWEAAAQRAIPGEGAQWTNTWEVKPSKCAAPDATIAGAFDADSLAPALCGTVDELDACDGAVLCGTLHTRIWKDPAAATARKGASSLEDGGGKGIRCATSTTYLTRFPSRWTTKPRERPADPTPPTPEQLAIMNAVGEDTLDVPPCPKVGRSFLTCRDPRSYLKSNEPRLNVLAPYVENMGGGYTGVASDQNYTFIALARSQWAWVFDYDPNVVRWHHVLRAMILDAPDRAAFVERFKKASLKRGAEILATTYKDDPELANLVELYKSSGPTLVDHYAGQAKEAYTWLGTDEHYAYIRLLYQQGRMRALRGNMLDVHAMEGIGEAARKLSVPIHIYYPSNAAEFWVFTDQYRKNVRDLPFDDDSIVVQTISGISLKSGFGQQGYWHYNVQYGREQQALLGLKGYSREKQLLWHRVKTDSTELTTCGMPP